MITCNGPCPPGLEAAMVEMTQATVGVVVIAVVALALVTVLVEVET